jgi:HK97 family phage major capsid protein
LPFRITASGLDTKTNAAGEYTVGTRVSPNIVDQLRAATAVLRLGAQWLPGLKYNFQLPLESNVLTAGWVSENPGSDVAAADPSLGVRMLKGHPMQATTSYSRQLLAQSTPNIEAWMGSRLARAHGLLLDKAAIHGSGTGNEPTGLLNISGIGNVAVGVNGGALTSAHVIGLESAVSDANADVGNLAWLTNSKQRAKLRAVPELTSGTFPIWKDGTMLGYPTAVSNQVRSDLTKGTSSNCSALIFGNWNALIVAEFNGAMEVTFDPYAQKKQGMIEVTSYAAYDIGLSTLLSFGAVLDAI